MGLSTLKDGQVHFKRVSIIRAKCEAESIKLGNIQYKKTQSKAFKYEAKKIYLH
jgi:hypothetical protein